MRGDGYRRSGCEVVATGDVSKDTADRGSALSTCATVSRPDYLRMKLLRPACDRAVSQTVSLDHRARILIASFSRSTYALAILGRIRGRVLRQWPVVREREIPTVADHHMIEECDAEELARLGDPSREGPVFGARRGIAARVVVNDDQASGVQENGTFEDFPGVDDRVAECAHCHMIHPDGRMFCIEKESIKMFAILVFEDVFEVTVDVFR